MKLSDYLNNKNLSAYNFAKKLGVSYQTVYRWLDNTRIPSRHYEKILHETKGEVTPNDFILDQSLTSVNNHYIYSRKDGDV